MCVRDKYSIIFVTEINCPKVKNPSHPLIFTIDNSPVYRKIIKSCLEALDYKNIHTYSNCEEMQSAKLTPDIIILDQDFGNKQMKGLDFFIRYKVTNPNVHFIFLSSNTKIEIAVDSIKFGAYDYIIKSRIGLERMVMRINGLVNNQKIIRAQKKVSNAVILSLGMFSIIFVTAVILYNHQLI
jgi:DNA-binding NarL/FixJ family response regulator